jgi:hypothetical protein
MTASAGHPHGTHRTNQTPSALTTSEITGFATQSTSPVSGHAVDRRRAPGLSGGGGSFPFVFDASAHPAAAALTHISRWMATSLSMPFICTIAEVASSPRMSSLTDG